MLLLHQIFFLILYFIPLSVKQISSLHCHKVKLTKAYLAAVAKSLENQLLNQCSSKSTKRFKGAPHDICLSRKEG